MRPRGTRWFTALAALGIVMGGAATVERLPAPATTTTATSTATNAASSLASQRNRLAAEAAALHRQIAAETALLATESAKLRQRIATPLRIPVSAVSTQGTGRVVTTGIPTTHTTTGASASRSANGGSEND